MTVLVYPGRLHEGKVEFAGQVDLPEGREVLIAWPELDNRHAVLAPDAAR